MSRHREPPEDDTIVCNTRGTCSMQNCLATSDCKYGYYGNPDAYRKVCLTGLIPGGPSGRQVNTAIVDDIEPVAPPAVARKDDTAKVRTDLLPSAPLLAIAEVLTFGAKKYDDNNWRGGFKYSRLIGAAMRHILAYNDGEDKDPESGLSHLAHAGCCIAFLLEQEAKGTGTDDRYKA